VIVPILCLQAFKGRLLEVIDQAQHFAALGPAGGGGPSADAAQSFREGLDGTERECQFLITMACLNAYSLVCSVCIGPGTREKDETME
jgi:hypothetical protein